MTDNDMRHDDPVAYLATMRPDAQLAHEWDDVTSTAVLDRIVATPRGAADTPRFIAPRRLPVHRRRWAVAGLVAAGAAAAVVVGVALPAGTPGGPDRAAAAELRRLAVVAGHRGAPVGSKQYAYTALVEEQTVEHPSEPPAPGDTRVGDVDRRPRRDVWFAPTGVRWTQIGERACLTRSSDSGASADDGVYEDLTGAQLAKLPTDAGRLAEFIDDHPAGDNRGSVNRFLVVGDLVRSGLASPQLRAAALRVLATTDEVTVRTGGHDDRNRPATIASHRVGDSTEQVLFDPTTSAVLEQRQTLGDTGGHYSGVFLANRVVDRLPDLPRCAPDTSDPTHGHGG